MAAIAGAAVPATGCKDNVEVVDVEPEWCLHVAGGQKARGEEGSLARSTDKEFVVTKGDARVVEGSVRAERDGLRNTHASWSIGSTVLDRARSCLVEAVERGETVSGTVDQTLEVSVEGGATSTGISSTGEISQRLRGCLEDRTRGSGFSPGAGSKVLVRWTLKHPGG
jgi:hypothetical protein